MPLVQGSVATWTSHVKAWQEWLTFYPAGVPFSVSLAQRVTATFLGSLRTGGASVTLARTRLSGIAFMLKLRRLEDVTKLFLFAQALKGWKRESVRVDTRRPISSLLKALISSLANVCSSDYECVLFSSAFALAFFGALRVGELVPTSRTRVGGLRQEDIVISNNVLKIHVARSKTDVFGDGTWLPVQAIDTECCPVSLVRSFLAVRAGGLSFLTHEDGSPFTRFQFSAVFKQCIVHCGLNPKYFGTHSFRIGAATVADAGGLPLDQLKSLGRWRSDCYRRYIRLHLLH